MATGDDSLIEWMLRLNAQDAAKELATFAGAADKQLSDLDDHAKSLKFANKVGWAATASPALAKTLEDMASLRKNAFGVEAAMQVAVRSVTGFDDLEEELRVINQLFLDGAVNAETAQRAFGKVSAEGLERQEQMARLADDVARREDAHWKKIDAERVKAEEDAARIARDNERREDEHWKHVEEQRRRIAKEQQAAEVEIANRRQQGFSQLRLMGGLAVGGGLAAIGMKARSGFADTLQGQQSAAYGQMLNRQVASIFAPMLEEKTRYVAQMTGWLQGLSEPQRESIRMMTAFATVMGTLTLTVGASVKALRLINNLEAVPGLRGLIGFSQPFGTTAAAMAARAAVGTGAQTAAGATAMLGSGVGGAAAAGGTAAAGTMAGAMAILGPLAVAVAGLVAILSTTEEGRSAMMDLLKAFEPLLEVLGELAAAFKPFINELAFAVKEFAGAVKWFNENIRDAAATKIGSGILSGLAEASTDPFGLRRTLRQLGILGPVPTSTASSGIALGIPKGFEDLEATFIRINEASTKIDLNRPIVAQLEQLNQQVGQLVAQGNQTGVSVAPGPQNFAFNLIGQ